MVGCTFTQWALELLAHLTCTISIRRHIWEQRIFSTGECRHWSRHEPMVVQHLRRSLKKSKSQPHRLSLVLHLCYSLLILLLLAASTAPRCHYCPAASPPLLSWPFLCSYQTLSVSIYKNCVRLFIFLCCCATDFFCDAVLLCYVIVRHWLW